MTKKHKLLEISIRFDDEFYDSYADRFSDDLCQNIKRRFVQGIDKETQIASVKHIKGNDLLGFSKVNMFSIAAFMGKSEVLEIASENFDMLMGLNGKTLIQVCGETNDIDSISICLAKIAQG